MNIEIFLILLVILIICAGCYLLGWLHSANFAERRQERAANPPQRLGEFRPAALAPRLFYTSLPCEREAERSAASV